MRNIGKVQIVQETRHWWLCKCDAVGWLVTVVSTWALLCRLWFQLHT